MNGNTYGAEGRASIDDIMVSLMAEVNNMKNLSRRSKSLGPSAARCTSTSALSRIPEPRAVCLVDGDTALFSRELYEQGWDGGSRACRDIIEAVRRATERGCEVQVYCFAKKNNVIKALADASGLNGVASDVFGVQFDDFVKGFNSVEPGQGVMVDLGRINERTDARIKGFLQRELRSPSVTSVVLAARYETSYTSEINALITRGSATKLKLLSSCSDESSSYKALKLDMIPPIDGIFQSGKSWRRKSLTTNGADVRSPPPMSSSSVSRLSPASPTVAIPSNGAAHAKVLWKTASGRMPCFKYHLTPNCKYGANCKSSHESISSEQLETLRAQAGRRPCDLVKNGMECRRRDCPFGHRTDCPHGMECWYLAQGKCRFGDATAHSAYPRA